MVKPLNGALPRYEEYFLNTNDLLSIMAYYLYRKSKYVAGSYYIDSANSLREARKLAIEEVRSKRSDCINIKEDDLWDSKIQSFTVFFSRQYGTYVFAKDTPFHRDAYTCKEDGRLGRLLFSRDYD